METVTVRLCIVYNVLVSVLVCVHVCVCTLIAGYLRVMPRLHHPAQPKTNQAKPSQTKQNSHVWWRRRRRKRGSVGGNACCFTAG